MLGSAPQGDRWMVTNWTNRIGIALGCLLLNGCVSETTVIRVDFRKSAGVYVVGYTTNSAIRLLMEDQLVGDIIARGMVAYPSHTDIDDITASTPAQVIDKANDKKAVGVLVINQVAADASDSVIKNPKRVSPTHPDIQAFYKYSKEQNENFEEGLQVFAEVNLFIIDGETTNLLWSGTTWSFHADNRGSAVVGISEIIADQLRLVRDRYRKNAFEK